MALAVTATIGVSALSPPPARIASVACACVRAHGRASVRACMRVRVRACACVQFGQIARIAMCACKRKGGP
jgi:hypothetical protein